MAYFIVATLSFTAGVILCALFKNRALAVAQKELADLKASATRAIGKL